MSDEPRIERLIAMAERLIVALEGDIAALQSGNPRAMKTTNPDIQSLSTQYSREAQGFDPASAKGARAELKARFAQVTKKFRDVLALHGRMLARARGASEGMVRAIAAEVERMRAPTRIYGPRPGYAPAAPGAMVFNKIV
mgnify:CR=1 FL=1